MANSDRAARSVVEEMARRLPHAAVSCSVAHGVAIASWKGADLEPSVFAGDYASVGALLEGDSRAGERASWRFCTHRPFGRQASSGARSLRRTASLLDAHRLDRRRMQPPAAARVACRSRRAPESRLRSRYTRSCIRAAARPATLHGCAWRVRTNTIVDIDAAGHAQTRSGPSGALGPELALFHTGPRRRLAARVRGGRGAELRRRSTSCRPDRRGRRLQQPPCGRGSQRAPPWDGQRLPDRARLRRHRRRSTSSARGLPPPEG